MQRPPPPNAFSPGTVLTVGSHKAVVVKYISEGGFAHVYEVKISPAENGTAIACLKRVVVPDKHSLNTLRAEVDSMKRVSGFRHIVSYIDSHAARLEGGQGYEVFVLMELCSKKGLIDFMNTRLQNRLTEPEVLRIMGEITEGVANMHALKPPLLHRDIKIENVLIADNGDYKLCDFGSASPVLRPPRNSEEFSILQNDILKNTTPQYRSPEMVDLYRGLPIDEKSDVWALGVFLYKVCYYTTPFESKGELALLHAKFDFPQKPVYSDRLKNLISVLLREDPRRRPNAFQTLEEVCRMRGVPTPIVDFTNVPLSPPSSSVDLLQPPPPQQQKQFNGQRITNSVSPIPSISMQPTPITTGVQNNAAALSKSTPNLRRDYTTGTLQDPRFAVPKQSQMEIGLNKNSFSKPPPKPPRPQTFASATPLEQSIGNLSISSKTTKPQVPAKPKYVDSVVQTDDGETIPPKTKARVSHQRPKSMYASTPSFENRQTLDPYHSSSHETNELKRIITGLSTTTSADTVELSPGENNHIDNSVDFLKSLQQQDSGKSWVQQTTGGSLRSLRHISTGSKKRSSLIGQVTGMLSRTHSRSSSRASSIHESSGIYHSNSNSLKYKSSSESIEEEIVQPQQIKIKTGSSSIQRRIQGLLNRQGDPPVVRTAKGYGNDATNESGTSKARASIDNEGFKQPPILKKPIALPKRKTVPQTPPLSAQSTPSTVTRTPASKDSDSKSSDSPSTLKKAPPKPKKPSHLKANASTLKADNWDPDDTLTRSISRLSDVSRVSDMSIPDIDDLEQSFHDRFPSHP